MKFPRFQRSDAGGGKAVGRGKREGRNSEEQIPHIVRDDNQQSFCVRRKGERSSSEVQIPRPPPFGSAQGRRRTRDDR
jgi:hypothetical protein